MADDMCKQNGLLLRGKTYYFQARIPQEIRKQFPAVFPKAVHRERLTATTLSQAKAQVRRKWAELEARFQELREPPKTALPEADAQRILNTLLVSRLAADEEGRFHGTDELREVNLSKGAAALAECDAEERAAATRGVLTAGLQEKAQDLLRWFGYELPADSREFRSFALKFARSGQRSTSTIKRREAGEFVDTPPAPTEAPQGDTTRAPVFGEVVDHFLNDYHDQKKPMYRKHTAVLPLLREFIGADKPVDKLKQMEVEEFFKFISRLPPRWKDEARKRRMTVKELAAMEHPRTIAPKTFEDTYMASVRPFLATAKRLFGDRGFPGHLTTDGIEYRGSVKEGENKQWAFKADELRSLFSHLGQYAADADEAHKIWLPLIGLYTGARVNEICQLNPQVDIEEEGGIPYFNFTSETEGHADIRKSIKNPTSKRKVPIHSALLEAGLMRYVEAMRQRGAKLLFPRWKPKGGKASGKAEGREKAHNECRPIETCFCCAA